jgi:S-formylglutathione hydrolase
MFGSSTFRAASSSSGGVEKIGENKCFGGQVQRFKHTSGVLGGLDMKFTLFVPPGGGNKAPVIFWLSGLTCTDENFTQKAGAFRKAAEEGVALVMPDTSPRGANIKGEDDSYDFGSGAGFYVNATTPEWSKHYRMYDYVVQELPELLASEFPMATDKISIMGHSMGGHGALTIALKNPGVYKSCSAFAPICNPTLVPWGEKAFTGYLGDNPDAWKEYDACELVKKYKGPDLHLYVDQGTADNFFSGEINQLQPDALKEACKEAGVPLTLNLREGYDHSYFFMASYIDDHIAHHVKCMA